jgi:hypothetical protein
VGAETTYTTSADQKDARPPLRLTVHLVARWPWAIESPLETALRRVLRAIPLVA